MFVGSFTYRCGLVTVFRVGDLVEHCPIRFYNAVHFLADNHSIFYFVQPGIDLRAVVAVYLVTLSMIATWSLLTKSCRCCQKGADKSN